MAEIKIAGIMRAGIYSPNHIGNDAAILNIVAEQLRKRGFEVNTYSEEQFCAGKVTEHIILNMCRQPASIELLQQREDDGDLVLNSGYGIENCIRERMARILLGSGIPYPESFVVNTDEGVRTMLTDAGFNQCWIKRADCFAMHKEDVTYVRHIEEAQEMLQEFFLRGIKRAVINRHLPGELVKFYGVAGTSFFFWFYPREDKPTADSPATDTHTPFDVEELKRICARAAEVLDVKIYGGDCIIGAHGAISIIDFKDWPSFAPCRNEAAPQIARLVMKEIKERNKK
ncbi:MAG: hypothetical protein HDS78_02420 [Bacteroidales bacterium]|nr:hypothetical protein [Bacteroidales bacterium]MBD5219288.1 hypothetical protein [Bacteroidales bacterium]MDE6437152.1 hypothetical protein [Muribaculaceae bacterium]